MRPRCVCGTGTTRWCWWRWTTCSSTPGSLASGGVTILYHNGTAGNQSPRWDVKGQTFDEAERLGTRLADAVWPALDGLGPESFDDEPALRGVIRTVTLPWRALPGVSEAREIRDAYDRTYERLKAEGASHGPLRTAECDMFGAHETLYYAECYANGTFQELMRRYDPLDVQALRIGGACMVGYPGELFAEYGLMTKWLAPCRTVPVTLVNGETQGYIVTPAAVREGRYETHNRSFAPEAGGLLVNAGLDAVRELRAGTGTA